MTSPGENWLEEKSSNIEDVNGRTRERDGAQRGRKPEEG